MNKYDQLLAAWAKTNAETIYHHLETKVNQNGNWRDDDIVKIVTELIGWPSEWAEQEPEPYFEELQHALNDYQDEFGIPIPPELLAIKISNWAQNKIAPTHPLVANAQKWRNIYYKMEYDDADPKLAIRLVNLCHNAARGETQENLPTIEDIKAHYASPSAGGKLYTIGTENGILHLAINDQWVAALNKTGITVALDFDGNRLYAGQDLSRIEDYIVQGIKFSKPLTDKGELASLVGNTTASLLLGDNGISIFDLPN